MKSDSSSKLFVIVSRKLRDHESNPNCSQIKYRLMHAKTSFGTTKTSKIKL